MSGKISDHAKGLVWIFVWAGGLTLALSIAKMLPPGMPTVMLVGVRYLISSVFVLPLTLRFARRSTLKTARLPLYVLRVAATSLATVMTYYAYRNLPVSVATVIGFSGPLFTPPLAMLLLGERVRPIQWAALAAGYAGLFLITAGRSGIGADADISLTAILVELGANALASAAIIIAKRLVATEPDQRIFINCHWLAAGLFAVLLPFHWQACSREAYMILTGVGFFASLSQFAYIRALSYHDASYLAPFEYSRLLLAVPIGVFVFHERLSWLLLPGAALIIGGTYMLARRRDYKKEKS